MRPRVATASLLLFAAAGLAAHAEPRGSSSPPAALVTSVRGEVRVRTGAADRPLQLHDWLPRGATIRAGGDADLILVFASGRRFRVAGPATLTVELPEPRVRRGKAERLADVPPLPLAAPLDASTGVAAVRIRAHANERLYPADPARALANDVRLLFPSDLPAERYTIELSDEQGVLLLTENTRQTWLQVRAGLLAPGRRYYWRVRAELPSGTLHVSDATFATLPPDVVARRAAVHETEGDALWLAALDEQLGLLREARDRLRSAKDDTRGGTVSEALHRLDTAVP